MRIQPVVLVVGFAISWSAWSQPLPGTPGRVGSVDVVSDRCPTFSWSAVPGAVGYRLTVYRAEPDADSGEWAAVIDEDVGGGITSWTPPLDLCLAGGDGYAWLVAAVGRGGGLLWSEPRQFRVPVGPAQAEVDLALELLRRVLESSDLPDEPGEASPRESPPEEAQPEKGSEPGGGSAARRSQRGGLASFRVAASGAVTASSFAGDGSGLTGVDADLLDGVDASSLATASALAAHAASTANPHSVTATQASPASAKGDLEVFDGADIVRLPAGSDGQVLQADSASPGGLGWADAGGPKNESCPLGWSVVGFDAVGGPVCRAGRLKSTFRAGATIEGLAASVGPDGRPSVAYSSDLTTIRVVRYLRCSDPACTSSSDVGIASESSVHDGVDLAFGSDQLPILVYADSADDLVVSHCDDADCSTNETNVLDALGGDQPSIAIGSDGLPVIAYVDSNSDLKVAHCTDVACGGRTLETAYVGTVATPSLAIGAVDPVIALEETSSSMLVIVVCDNLTCSESAFEEVVAGSASGLLPTLMVADKPFVLFNGQSSLFVLLCLGSPCGLAGSTPVDSVATSPGALTIGDDGLPVLAYTTAGKTVFARCQNLTCGSVSGAAIEAESGGVDLVIGSDGLPFLAYDTDAIATLHCANPNCS